MLANFSSLYCTLCIRYLFVDESGCQIHWAYNMEMLQICVMCKKHKNWTIWTLVLGCHAGSKHIIMDHKFNYSWKEKFVYTTWLSILKTILIGHKLRSHFYLFWRTLQNIFYLLIMKADLWITGLHSHGYLAHSYLQFVLDHEFCQSSTCFPQSSFSHQFLE